MLEERRRRILGVFPRGIAGCYVQVLKGVNNADVIRSDPSILDERAEAMAMIEDVYESAKEAAHTVRRLREFYRPHDEEERAELGLNDLVDGAIDYCRPRWQEEMRARGVFIDVVTDLAEIPKVLVSGTEIRELLVNLVMNAVDAIEQKGTITIATRESESGVLLTVADTGVGMPEDVRKRCLEPFFSTKNAHGTGIGLSMAYGAVQRHHGRLEIDSAPGTGTTVPEILCCAVWWGRGRVFFRAII